MTVGELRDRLKSIEDSRFSIEFEGVWTLPLPVEGILVSDESVTLVLDSLRYGGMATKEAQITLDKCKDTTKVYLDICGEIYKNLELRQCLFEDSPVVRVVKDSMTVGDLMEELKNFDKDSYITYGNKVLTGLEGNNGDTVLELRDD